MHGIVAHMTPFSGIGPVALEQEARRIIRLLRDDFRLPDGGFAIDKIGGHLMPQHIFHDLGDFVPFLMYFGERELVTSQVQLFNRLAPGGILVSEYPSARMIHGLAKSYEYTDLLLGLAAYSSEAKMRAPTETALTTADAAIRIFDLEATPRSFYWVSLGVRIPIIDIRISTLIECYLELYALSGNEQYLRVAKNLYHALTGVPFFRRFGMFPDFALTGQWSHIPLRGRSWRSGAMHKSNTNTLFAFLDLYRATSDADILRTIRRMIDVIRHHMLTENGGVGERFDPQRPPQYAHLGASFSMIDFLCDIYMETKDGSDIALARTIADHWLSAQAPTGLFAVRGDSGVSFADSETDMIVALHKLFECTGDTKYLLSAESCLKGMLTHHGSRDYPISVNVRTGDVVDATQRTKFLCLFLKVIILRIELAKGKHIYTDKKLFELLKDR